MVLRVASAIFQWEPAYLRELAWVGAVLTMTAGNLAALYQQNLKRMLAFSSVAHAGYLLVPLTVYAGNNMLVTASVSFYLMAYLLMTTGAFAVLTYLTREGQERTDITALSGLGHQKPFLGFVFTFFMLSLAGIPPTLGFFGKYYLFVPAIQGGQVGLVVIALLNSVVSVYYYLRPVVAMYFGVGEKAGMEIKPMPQAVLVVVFLSLLTIGYFGLFPSQLLALLQNLQ